jgi:hypothetical protein
VIDDGAEAIAFYLVERGDDYKPDGIVGLALGCAEEFICELLVEPRRGRAGVKVAVSGRRC